MARLSEDVSGIQAWSVGRMATLVASGVVLLVCLIFAGSIFEHIDANQVLVVQSPISGKLSSYTNAGWKWQGFGRVTKYDKLSTYHFEIPVRFNDGGHGTMQGSINWEMPLDNEKLQEIQQKFGSQEAIAEQIIRTVTDKCVYMTGPLMSSKESYAEKRNSLIYYVEDQIENGVYKTMQKEVSVKDQMTGTIKTVTLVEIVVGPDGKPERTESSVIKRYGLKTSNFAMSSLPYDETVENQIKQQQQAMMEVQTAIAQAKQAEQKAITVAKEGEANAARAKWEQEVIKAKAVTEAQQKLEVAKLDRQAAEQDKLRQISLGEGEATRKRLVMSADGALEKKLEAYVEVSKLYASAMENYKGNWVPAIVNGGDGKQAGSGAQEFMNSLNLKVLRDLGLSLDLEGKSRTKGE